MARNDIVARYILAFDDRASKRLLAVSSIARTAAKSFALVSAAVVGVGAAAGFAAIKLANSFAARADEIAKFTKQTGFASDAMQNLEFMAARQGAQFEVVKKGIAQFNKSLGEMRGGYGTLASSVARLNPALADQLKGTKSAQEAYFLMLRTIARTPDIADKAALAAAAFGQRGAGAILRITADGEKALIDLENRAKFLRPAISEKALKSAEAYEDAMTDVKTAIGGVGDSLGAKLLPVLTPLLIQFADFIAKNRELISSKAVEFFEKFKGAASDIDFKLLLADIKDIASSLAFLLKIVAGAARSFSDLVGGPGNAMKILFAGALIGKVSALGSGLIKLGMGARLAAKGVGALGVVGKAGPQLPLVARMGSSIKKLGPIIARGALAFGPLGLAAAGAGAAAYAVYKNWDTIGPKLKGAVSKAGEVLMGFADTDWMAKGNDFGNQITSWLNTIDWAAIGTWFNTFFGKIGAQFESIDFVELAGNIGDKISAWFAGVDWAAVGSTIWTVISTIGTIMAAAVSFIGALAWRLLANGLGAAWEKIKTIAANVWQSIKDTAIGAINFIITKINTMIKLVSDLSFGLVSLPSIDKIASSNAAAANGAAAGLPRTRSAPLQGEVTVNLRDQGGRSVGRTRAPVTNSPRGGRRGGFGGGG